MTNATDVYSNPQLARWLDSMEGVPDWPQPGESPAEREARGSLRNQFHQVFGWLGTLSPGIVLASGLAYVGLAGSRWMGTSTSSMRGIGSIDRAKPIVALSSSTSP